MKTVYEGWEDPEKDSLTFLPADRIPALLAKGQLSKSATRFCRIEAETWEEAMTLYHAHNGWEPYKPLAED